MENETFIAIAPNYWGRGESIDIAKAELKNSGGSLVRYVVMKLPEGAYKPWLDNFGSMHWTWEDDADQTGQAVQVAQRGTKKK